MIHPDHPRAKELVGQEVVTPLFTVPVRITADERVDPEKGTGMVMCCTFGDTTDIEWWRDHKLPLRVIVTREGRIGSLAGIGGAEWPSLDLDGARAASAQLEGLTVTAARTRIVELLTEAGRIKGATPVTRMVPSAERSGCPLEILVTPQWFVRVLDKKEALIAKGREIRWYPEYMRQRFEIWTENLKWDWCISRQRYFGVPLPFWYSKRPGEEGKILPAHPEDLPVNPLVDLPRGYSRDEVEPDPDVMDTWATSSVSPQLNAQAIAARFAADPDRYGKLFPANLRPQAHEIIRTWTFYTILKSLIHADSVPWHDITLSGWALAQDGSKQSKSKGNALGPREMLARYGADVVRYWTATSRLGLDTVFSEDVLKVGKKLQTKLWNVGRFLMLQLEGFTEQPTTPAADLSAGIIVETFDKWILSRLARTVRIATDHRQAGEVGRQPGRLGVAGEQVTRMAAFDLVIIDGKEIVGIRREERERPVIVRQIAFEQQRMAGHVVEADGIEQVGAGPHHAARLVGRQALGRGAVDTEAAGAARREQRDDAAWQRIDRSRMEAGGQHQHDQDPSEPEGHQHSPWRSIFGSAIRSGCSTASGVGL
ncbi:MAG: class I tRNA ligase family protein [Aliidongia sp.]